MRESIKFTVLFTRSFQNWNFLIIFASSFSSFSILTPDVIQTEKSEEVDLQSASEIRKTALEYKFVDLLSEIEEQVKERNSFLDCFRKRV